MPMNIGHETARNVPQAGGHALTTLEPQPNRVKVPQKGCNTGRNTEFPAQQPPRNRRRHGALARIKDQHGQRQWLVTCAQDIGCTNVAPNRRFGCRRNPPDASKPTQKAPTPNT